MSLQHYTTTHDDSQMPRDTSSAVPPGKTSTYLRRVERSISKMLTRKLGRVVGGRFVVVLSAVGIEKKNGQREMFRVVGDDAYKTVAERMLPMFAELDKALKRPDAGLLEMPATAEGRARACRRLMADEWAQHTRGTPWQDKKQMYVCVRRGAPVFPWWAEVAATEFCNTALDAADVSDRVYRHLAPLVYARQRSEYARQLAV